jgi:predicted MPP superfamily phosphohydrolase
MNSLLRKWGTAAAAAGAVALLADSLFLEKYFFQVRRFNINHTKSKKKIRILLLTDLHFGHRLWPFHYKLARTINNLEPRLILISGDIIDQWGEAKPARRFFNLVDKTIPKLGIPGNHDNKNKVSRETLRAILELNNGRLLVNETHRMEVDGVPFTVTGLDDFIEGESRLADALQGVGKEKNHLLLVHSPLQLDMVAGQLEQINLGRPAHEQVAFSYAFAGHNHGGQVRLGPLVPYLPELAGRYINGWYNQQPPYLYVSKGFGTSAIPFRFGSRSEITVLEYGV